MHGAYPGPADWTSYTEGYITNTSNYLTLYIRYEDLKQDHSTISKINDFLGYPPLTTTDVAEILEATSFDKMKGTHKEVSGNTTGKSGGYKGKLSEGNLAAINKRVSELVERVGSEKVDLRAYVE